MRFVALSLLLTFLSGCVPAAQCYGCYHAGRNSSLAAAEQGGRALGYAAGGAGSRRSVSQLRPGGILWPLYDAWLQSILR